MKSLIVDDDPVMCDLIEDYCSRIDFIQHTIKVQDGDVALSLISTGQFDLIFLDLQLPGTDGRDILDFIPEHIPVILVTSDTSFGAQSYQYNVVGYLVKPFTYSQFLKAINKLRPTQKEKEQIFVKDGAQLVNIRLEDLSHIKSESNYVVFCLKDRKVMSLMKMKDLEHEILPAHFIRVHRSYIVNSKLIENAGNNYIVVAGERIPMSGSYKEALLQKLNMKL